MQEWWTYSLSDFLLFSPRTYYRMLGRHNQELWPAQLFTLGLGLGILALLRSPSFRRGQITAGVLAVLWAWVAWTFLWGRYAAINPAATYFAGLFAVETLLLLWTGVFRGDLRFSLRRDPAGIVGLVLFVAALVIYPWLAPLRGQPWLQAEVFGVFPDPTVLGTLGLLLLARGGSRWRLLIIPAVMAAIDGATLWVLYRAGNPQ